jgi:hypothetical protein
MALPDVVLSVSLLSVGGRFCGCRAAVFGPAGSPGGRGRQTKPLPMASLAGCGGGGALSERPAYNSPLILGAAPRSWGGKVGAIGIEPGSGVDVRDGFREALIGGVIGNAMGRGSPILPPTCRCLRSLGNICRRNSAWWRDRFSAAPITSTT